MKPLAGIIAASKITSFAKTSDEMMESIVTRTTRIIADQLGADIVEVRRETLLDDLGAGSLDRIEMAMLIEEEFGIEVGDDEAENLTTVQSVFDLVMSKH